MTTSASEISRCTLDLDCDVNPHWAGSEESGEGACNFSATLEFHRLLLSSRMLGAIALSSGGAELHAKVQRTSEALTLYIRLQLQEKAWLHDLGLATPTCARIGRERIKLRMIKLKKK